MKEKELCQVNVLSPSMPFYGTLSLFRASFAGCYAFPCISLGCDVSTCKPNCHATRGNAHSYRPFRASRQAGSVSFSNRAPLLWNALTPEIRETSSHAAFKRRCLAMLQQNSEHEQFMALCLNIPEFGWFSIEPCALCFPLNSYLYR